jgi:prepilin-type N-terminal cleavage/methylation domain-containing protein/prepilin-type processing-associated H-X9-DG protein
MHFSRPARRSGARIAAGFTLLEVLVVMGIIAIIFTILATTIGRVYDRAKIITCASNERGLYLACINYANDNNNMLPCPSLDNESPSTVGGPQVCWAMDQASVADFQVGTLWPYMPASLSARQQAIMCPSDTSGFARVGTAINAQRNFSYSFNAGIRGSAYTAMYLRQIAQPTVRVLIYEEFGPNDGACYGPTDEDDWLTGRHGGTNSTYVESATNYQNETYREIGRGNVCYFDGHVDLMTVSFYFTAPYAHFTPLAQ